MIRSTGIGNKLGGVYRGIVLKQLDNGRCKIYIPAIYPEEYSNAPDSLPDAEQAASLFGGGINGNGMFSYPDISAVVMCMFLNGDQNYPVYFASTLGGDVDPSNDHSAKSVYGRCLDTGKQEHKIHVGNSEISFNESGTIEITTRSGPSLKNGCSIKMDSQGYMKLTASKFIQLQAPSISLSCSNFTSNANVFKFMGQAVEDGDEDVYARDFSIKSEGVSIDTDECSDISIKTMSGQMNAIF